MPDRERPEADLPDCRRASDPQGVNGPEIRRNGLRSVEAVFPSTVFYSVR